MGDEITRSEAAQDFRKRPVIKSIELVTSRLNLFEHRDRLGNPIGPSKCLRQEIAGVQCSWMILPENAAGIESRTCCNKGAASAWRPSDK